MQPAGEEPSEDLPSPSGWGRAATIVPAVAVGYLTLAWLAVYLVDVFDLVDGERLVGDVEPPLMWVFLFRERGPTENLQWLLLAAGIVLAVRAADAARTASQSRLRVTWMLVAAALFFMLLEDIGDVRHLIADAVTGDPAERPMARTLLEVAYLGILGAIPLTAVVMGWQELRQLPPTWWRLLVGGALYGVAASTSVTRRVGEWYEEAGRILEDTIFLGRMPRFVADGTPSGFWLMDFLVEETLELAGAAFVVASILAYIGSRTSRPAP